MDLAAEYLQGIVNLANKAHTVQIVEIDGRKYTDKDLKPSTESIPRVLELDTLGAIKDYLTANPDGLDTTKTLVIVDGPMVVRVLSCLKGAFNQRFEYLQAARPQTTFPFGQSMNVEQFIIAVQTQFEQDENTAAILKIVGNITDGVVKQFTDDGVSQQVTAKVGVAKVADIPVPSPVELKPFRTFMEVKQPASKFIFRMRSGEPTPTAQLIEADGGAWMLDAVSNIKFWLQDNLPKEVVILA